MPPLPVEFAIFCDLFSESVEILEVRYHYTANWNSFQLDRGFVNEEPDADRREDKRKF